MILDPYRFGIGGIDTFTKLMLRLNGTNGSTTFTDSSASPKTGTAVGNAQISTAQSKFGGASAAFDGSGDSITFPTDADFALPGDFTYDFWVYFTATTGAQTFVRTEVNSGFGLRRQTATGNVDVIQNNVSADASFAWAPSTGVWYHVAVTRSGTSLRLFINGTQTGSTATVSTSYVQGPLRIGNDGANVEPLNGYIDEFRFSKGIARWTANFTPPAKQYS